MSTVEQAARFIDELDAGFGWIEPARMQRSSHALAIGGQVWIVDPIEADGVDERIRALGEPAAVIQLLDRHERDCAAFATRFDVQLHVAPGTLAGAPFQLLPVVRNRWWREVALWWPERRVLACADALGTIPFFRAGDEVVGVHPFLRLLPLRALRDLDVEHLLVGHGEGLHGEATAALVDDALRHARRRIPRWLAGVPRIVRSG
jgi:hypothetical protein